MKKGCASKYKIPSKNMQAEYPKTWPYEGSFNEYWKYLFLCLVTFSSQDEIQQKLNNRSFEKKI